MNHMWDERGFFYYRKASSVHHSHFLYALVAGVDVAGPVVPAERVGEAINIEGSPRNSRQ